MHSCTEEEQRKARHLEGIFVWRPVPIDAPEEDGCGGDPDIEP